MENVLKGAWVVWFVIFMVLASPLLIASAIEDFVDDIYDDDMYYGGE